MQPPHGHGPGGYPPPQGYPPQPQPQAHPRLPQPYVRQHALAPQAPSAMHAPARTVYGVPLEPGERVLYYKRNAQLHRIIFGLVFGPPLILMLGLGIYIIYSAFTHKRDAHYAQAITNRRLLAMNGYGKPLFAVRWEEVAGLNKVTGRHDSFGVRNAAGEKFMYDEDVFAVERVIQQCVDMPRFREQAPEVPFEAAVV